MADLVTVNILGDARRFVAELRRASDAVRRFAVVWDRDYVVTGVEPFGGLWPRRQMMWWRKR